MIETLKAAREYAVEVWRAPWRPLSRAETAAWLAFYVLFLLYAAANKTGFLFLDHVNLVVHEAGHMLFSYLGPVATVWGGTLLQWAVPFLLATYFFTQRQAAAFAFCLFVLFENFLYTATYIADARAQALPLVVVGDPELGAHDWNVILSRLGLLHHDRRIGGVVRLLGWVGMLAVPAWLALRGFLWQTGEQAARAAAASQR